MAKTFDNPPVLKDLLYIGEHLTCNHYRAEVGAGFIYREIKKGERLGSEQTPSNQLLVILEGACTIDYEHYPQRVLKAGEMVLVRHSSEFVMQVTEDLKLLTMAFVIPLSVCDKLVLESYYGIVDTIKYDFRPTPIRHPLNLFFDQLVYYLRNGMSCAHLHELKHKELFLCLRGFYKKEEIAYLFCEIIERSLDFRRFIYDNHQRVKSVEELVQLSNMSKSAFSRKFKQEFDMTPHDWLLKRKCEQIVWYAANPEVTIDQLCDRFGYSSKESFNNFCQSQFGCTPKRLIERSRRV